MNLTHIIFEVLMPAAGAVLLAVTGWLMWVHGPKEGALVLVESVARIFGVK